MNTMPPERLEAHYSRIAEAVRRQIKGECPVVFWDHEGDEDQVPEVIAANFLEWLDYMSSF